MKSLDCASCGSKEFVEEDGFLLCIYCHSKYVALDVLAPPSESVIGVASDIRALLQKCIEDPANSRRYASLILDIDPTNPVAIKYLT